MTNKKIIIDDIDVNALCSDEIACMNRYEVARLFIKTVERLVTKEQENEELRQYHNKCCEENTKELAEWLEKYNQISRDFHNGKYCNKENCNLLKDKEQECKELKNLLKVRIEDLCDSCGASSMMPMPCKVYEKTLIEIKKIAERYTTCKMDWYFGFKNILQKISECEVENA